MRNQSTFLGSQVGVDSISASASNQRMTASAAGEEKIDFKNLAIFDALPGDIFNELNHELKAKSIPYSFFANIAQTIE